MQNGRKVLGGERNVLLDQVMWKNRGSVRRFLFWTHDITYWTPVPSPICGRVLCLFFKNCVTWHCTNAYAFVGFCVQSFTAVQYKGQYASQSQWPRSLRRGFAAARFPGLRGRIPPVHACLSVVSVVCCQVEVSTTDRSLIQRSATECGVSECDVETSTLRPRPRGLSSHEETTVRDARYKSRGSCHFVPHLATFCLQTAFHADRAGLFTKCRSPAAIQP